MKGVDMGICGCADGIDGLLRSKKVCGVKLIQPCDYCDYTVIFQICQLEPLYLQTEKQNGTPEIKFDGYLNFTILDFEEARKIFMKEAKEWFIEDVKEEHKISVYESFFDDFIRDVFKRAIQKTWSKTLEEDLE